MRELDGAILIDKDSGWTSHDVVAKVRNHFHLKKVGHCGTLDPNATGLLILVLGKGTKLSERLMGEDKFYEGTMKLGETTDSYDSDGEITQTSPIPPITLATLNEEASRFIGDHLQTPPMVSAVKVDGVPLYKMARQGKTVERKARLVHIYRFGFTHYQEPEGHFSVACTKGTYVRTLAHDLGNAIGCGAHLTALRRTQSGRFSVNNAISISDLISLDANELSRRVIPITKLAQTR